MQALHARDARSRAPLRSVISHGKLSVIRLVQPEDLTRIAELCRRAFELEYDPVMLRQYFDLFSEMYLVAESEGNIHGYCIGAVKPQSDVGWILDLAVDVNMRSKGIGKNLVSQVLNRLELANVKIVFLTVNPNNTHAKDLYRSVGFKAEKTRSNYFVNGEDKLIMKMTCSKKMQLDVARASPLI